MYEFIDKREADTPPPLIDQNNTTTTLADDQDKDGNESPRTVETLETVTTWAALKKTSRTKLPNGRLSILADIGSRINLIGANTAQDMALKAAQYGHETKFEKRKHVLHVNGVGAGSAPCEEQAQIPIAVKYEDMPTTLQDFLANVATGSGEDLPGIMGLISMQEKDVVLILRKGKEIMALPGKGGYKIVWSPGTKLLPMTPAPSGHLVVPCDNFDEVKKQGPLEDHTTLITDHCNPTPTDPTAEAQ